MKITMEAVTMVISYFVFLFFLSEDTIQFGCLDLQQQMSSLLACPTSFFLHSNKVHCVSPLCLIV